MCCAIMRGGADRATCDAKVMQDEASCDDDKGERMFGSVFG